MSMQGCRIVTSVLYYVEPGVNYLKKKPSKTKFQVHSLPLHSFPLKSQTSLDTLTVTNVFLIKTKQCNQLYPLCRRKHFSWKNIGTYLIFIIENCMFVLQ